MIYFVMELTIKSETTLLYAFAFNWPFMYLFTVSIVILPAHTLMQHSDNLSIKYTCIYAGKKDYCRISLNSAISF